MLKEGYGRAANTKGYITKQLMTWVDYGLERKRGRDSTGAVRGSLKLTIRLFRGKEIYVLHSQLVMPVVVGICLMEYAFRLTYSPL